MKLGSCLKPYLFWCANEHVEFRLAEFDALLHMFQIEHSYMQFQADCCHQVMPTLHLTAATCTPQSRLVSLNGSSKFAPWLIIGLRSDADARRILSRSMFAKFGVRLWAAATTQSVVNEQLRCAARNHSAYSDENIVDGHKAMENLRRADVQHSLSHVSSFKIEVKAFMQKLSQAQKMTRIENYNFLPFGEDGTAVVSLDNPELTLVHLECPQENVNSCFAPKENSNGERHNGGEATVATYDQSMTNFADEGQSNVRDRPPNFIFFGPQVGEGQRRLGQEMAVKRRKFIGNTSMDAQLALIMANLAQIQANDVVCDPFVGTGSILVAAGKFGARCFGSDIDYLMLHGRTRSSRVTPTNRRKLAEWQNKAQHIQFNLEPGKRAADENVEANFWQYQCQDSYMDVVVADISRSPWRTFNGAQPCFDAIVTDPPYGVREPLEKVGRNNSLVQKSATTPIGQDNNGPVETCAVKTYADHFPEKTDYSMDEMYVDLMEFAAKSLRTGGRLVFWVPVDRELYAVGKFKMPSHPQFTVLANCEQILNCHASRRLLVMGRLDGRHRHERGCDGKQSESEAVTHGGSMTASRFRDLFYNGGSKDVPCRKDRMALVKQFGHLNKLSRSKAVK